MSDTDKKNSLTETNSYDEIDLGELFHVLWKGATLIILTTSAVAIGSIIFSLQLTNIYESQTITAVRKNAKNYSGGLSQYSGVASMIGVELGTSGEDKGKEIMELIKSRSFVKHLIEFEDILPSIMAPKSFDRGSNTLIFDKEIYDPDSKVWIREPNINGSIKPTYLEAHRVYIRDLLSVSQDKLTGFIKLSIEHQSPVFAGELLELVLKEANNLMRVKDLKESNQAIQYLKSELANTSYVEIKESIHSIMESQLETQMLAKINDEYILTTIEPPFIPEERSSPHRALICILSTLAAGLLSILWVLLRHYGFPSNNKESEA